MLKLSIITINYNNCEGLKRTLESVVNQTWQEFEYIVIDGGSIDGSAAYIESQIDKINYWVSEPDRGIYNAMNKGIAKATGEYLLFLNSGDHFHNNKVLAQNHRYLKKKDLVYFNIKMVDGLTSKIISYPKELRFSFLFQDALCHQSTFIKKELFDTVGLYDEYLRMVSDWKFMMVALFKHNCSYAKIDAILANYYLDGISSREDLSGERNQVLKEYFGGFLEDYEERNNSLKILNTNRFKMLLEIEKSKIGMKLVSVFFRSYVVLFSKKKIKDILKYE